MRNKTTRDDMNEFSFKCRMAFERFRDDARGVAAIEFAFIFPLMLILYIGTIEVSSALSANRKVSRVSSTIADLVTQGECFTPSDLDDIEEIADDIMFPYNTSLQITLTALLIDDDDAIVQWSRGWGGAIAPAVDSEYAVPDRIKVDGNFLVSALVETTYEPAFGWITKDSNTTVNVSTTGLDLSEELFLRPRIGNAIELRTAGSC